LQVAADRKTSSYVLCRDGRQAQLLADPKTDDDAYTGRPSLGRDLFPRDRAGLVAAAETWRQRCSSSRSWPGCVASPTSPDRPGLQPSRGCTCGPGRTGPARAQMPPEPPRRRQPGPCAPPHRPARRAFYRLIRRLGVNRREIAAHDQLIGGTSRIRVASAAMADDSFVMGAGGVPARPRRAPRGALQCCHVRSRCRACRLA
jgi:hypothetical protein